MSGLALRLVGLLAASFLATSGAFAMGNRDKVEMPIKQHEEVIRGEVLHYTPLGSSPEEVLAFIKDRLVHKHTHAEPYYDTRNGVQVPQPKGWPSMIGKRSISVLIGRYGRNIRTLFSVSTEVHVYWAFDESDRLIEVIVVKEQEGP